MQHLKIVETRKISEILTVKGYGTEGVWNIKYLCTVINNTDEKQKKPVLNPSC
jgi:hypothetical protein